MSENKVKLFLSHASEDMDVIAKPLYHALKDEFDVWYDQARIRLENSFYEKISEGIRECDFGVVIFSPHFFRKRWTKQEIDGLLALQRNQRKVVLPIVHDMTHDDLADQLPIMATKKTISSNEGIQTIVVAIRAAVGTDQQNKYFDKEPLNRAFQDFHSATKFKATATRLSEINDRLSRTREGARKVHEAATSLVASIKTRVDELTAEASSMTAKLLDDQPPLHVLVRAGQYGFVAGYNHPEAISDIMLEIVYLRFESSDDRPIVLRETGFFPLFTISEDVVWGSDDPKAGQTNAQVIETILMDFVEFLKEQNAGPPGADSGCWRSEWL
jgi:hypothetical protein